MGVKIKFGLKIETIFNKQINRQINTIPIVGLVKLLDKVK